MLKSLHCGPKGGGPDPPPPGSATDPTVPLVCALEGRIGRGRTVLELKRHVVNFLFFGSAVVQVKYFVFGGGGGGRELCVYRKKLSVGLG